MPIIIIPGAGGGSGTVSSLTFAMAKSQLASRLYDPTKQFWSDAELGTLLADALRTWQALTGYWRKEFTFPTVPNQTWYDLTTQSASLRPQTLTDASILADIELALLEPLTPVYPLAWAGSSQFAIDDILQAINRRRDELLSVTGCQITRHILPAALGRTFLPDVTIDVRRIAYVPSPLPFVGTLIQSAGGTTTLKFQRRVTTFSAVGDQYIATGTYLNLGAFPVTIRLIAGANVASATILPGQQQSVSISILGTGAQMNYQILTQNASDSLVLMAVNPGAFDNTLTPGVNIFTGDALQFITGWSGQAGAVITLTQGISSIPATSTPVWIDDTFALESFSPRWTGNPAGTPTTAIMSAEPPVSFDVDTPPGFSGQYEVLSVDAGAPFSVLAATPLGIPDDWAWIIKWGALSDLLGRESNARDPLRATYAASRYRHGLASLAQAPAILALRIANVPLPVDSVIAMDTYAPTWQSGVAGPPTDALVAGLNLIALTPTPDVGPYSLAASVVQNAPIPVADTDPVMLSHEAYDAVLDYAQHLASFKQGGQEFAATAPLLDNFMSAAGVVNSRLLALGPYLPAMLGRSQLEERMRPRLEPAPDMLTGASQAQGGK